MEDDPDVREYAVATLEGLGYRALRSNDGASALQILKNESGRIDLMLTDVLLAGDMSGPEVAANALALYPHIKVVFMSGYASELYFADKIPGFDAALLNKPFKRAELAEAINEALAA